MFEGYAGSARADFRLAVERERALGQLDDIVAHYEAYLDREGPAGPGALRLRREFAQVQQELGDLPGRIMDRKRLAPCSPISGGPCMSASSMIACSTRRPRSASKMRRMTSERRRPCRAAAPTGAPTPA
ncbi:hypothetical protein [Mesorhizobium sp. M0296]|uniref:hypothetical protein n=1 Tax=Mesorhizobium sp. M0296 TaxID=2956931 RepID=UPI0033366858